MSARPSITVIIPAYNYAASLGRAVASVVPQLLPADELLVIDDGSTDDTPRVVEALHQQYPGAFRSIRKSNGGLASVRNLGIESARNDWLIFLDADDEQAEGALVLIRDHLVSQPDTRMVIGGHRSIDESGRTREHGARDLPGTARGRVQAYLLDKTISISNGACVMHRSVFTPGNYPEQFRNAEDIPVFAQVLAAFSVTTLPQPLAVIHKHSDSLRHDLGYSIRGGVELVDEVFQRLPSAMQDLKKSFYMQRCLSLFRGAYLSGDRDAAMRFYRLALASDWRTLLKLSYTRKALRVWLGKS